MVASGSQVQNAIYLGGGAEWPLTAAEWEARAADVQALALGDAAVLLGCPYASGAVGGQAGVEAVVTQLAAEIDLTLALVGARSVRELDGSLVA